MTLYVNIRYKLTHTHTYTLEVKRLSVYTHTHTLEVRHAVWIIKTLTHTLSHTLTHTLSHTLSHTQVTLRTQFCSHTIIGKHSHSHTQYISATRHTLSLYFRQAKVQTDGLYK